MGDMDSRATDWIDGDAAGSANNTALVAPSAKVPTTTQPETVTGTGRFVYDLREVRRNEGQADHAVHYDLAFFGQDADDETFSYQVWQWRPVGDTWVPRLLLVGDGVLGSRVGVAGGDLGDTWFLVDTINNTEDSTRGDSAQVDSATAGNGLAVLSFDADGSAMIEVEVSINGKSAARVRPVLAAK